LIQGERIVVTEKIHGTQFILAHNLEDSKTIVSSKGMLKQGFLLMKPKKVIHTGWLQKMMNKKKFYKRCSSSFGEVPVQGGYS
jgi:hypothetical protein